MQGQGGSQLPILVAMGVRVGEGGGEEKGGREIGIDRAGKSVRVAAALLWGSTLGFSNSFRRFCFSPESLSPAGWEFLVLESCEKPVAYPVSRPLVYLKTVERPHCPFKCCPYLHSGIAALRPAAALVPGAWPASLRTPAAARLIHSRRERQALTLAPAQGAASLPIGWCRAALPRAPPLVSLPGPQVKQCPLPS